MLGKLFSWAYSDYSYIRRMKYKISKNWRRDLTKFSAWWGLSGCSYHSPSLSTTSCTWIWSKTTRGANHWNPSGWLGESRWESGAMVFLKGIFGSVVYLPVPIVDMVFLYAILMVYQNLGKSLELSWIVPYSRTDHLNLLGLFNVTH